MKNFLIIPVFLLVLGCEGQDPADEIISDTSLFADTTQIIPLSQSLIFMREEEKLARDVYLQLYQSWEKPIFENIAASEQKHMDAVLRLLDMYSIADPVGDNGIGQFSDSSLQKLHDELVASGSQSLVNALEVGALIEEVDINDLNLAIDSIDVADILLVYENLNKGSRNHLRAFYRNLQAMGEDYEPQILDEQYFEEIVNSAQETNGKNRRGK
jgi:hypothetical protein